MLRSQRVTVIFLALSAALGIEILAEEVILGAAGGRFLFDPAFVNVWAPVPHAYGLMAFIVIDVILIGLVWRSGRHGATAAFVWALLQFLALALNPLSAPQFPHEGTDSDAIALFASYLFGIWGYDATLAVQVPLALFAFKVRGQLRAPAAPPSAA